jgi:hypothetical protein
MRVDPAIAAFRGERISQGRAQATMVAACDAWRADARIAPVFADLGEYGAGMALPECASLARLFAPGAEAAGFVAWFCAAHARALAGEPLGQLPFRHNFDGALSTLLLARSGAAQLTLTALEPGEYEAASVTFSDAESHAAVIAGAAHGRETCRGQDGALAHRAVRLEAGRRLTFDLARQALLVGRVERRLVTLRLHRAAADPGPMREYALADGALLKQAAGTIRDSRHEMMLALLGRMQRREAAPLMAGIACENGPDSLRWEALREALALDTAQGFAALCAVSRSPLDPLAATAGALRAQLIEAHPRLRAFEETRCRA